MLLLILKKDPRINMSSSREIVVGRDIWMTNIRSRSIDESAYEPRAFLLQERIVQWFRYGRTIMRKECRIDDIVRTS